MTTPTRCAIYLRVSTDQQAAGHVGRYADETEDVAYGLDRQRSTCLAYAESKGWQVVEVFVEAKSGMKLWERPILSEVRRQFSQGRFDVLLVESLDRLSRKQNHQGLIFSEAERWNVAWDSATEDIDHSPQGQLLRTIVGALAEMERDKIVMRMRGGHTERIKAGKLPAMPRPKFGYRFGDDKKTFFIKHEEEAETVRLIHRLSQEGCSESAIRNELHARGRMAAEGKNWWTAAIHRVLTDTTYVGEVYANKWEVFITENGKKSKRLKPQEEWILIPDAAPPILTRLEWERTQESLKNHKKMAARNNYDPYGALLRRRIICGACGQTLTVANKSARNKHTIYIHATDGAIIHGCKFISITASNIDHLVWDQITDILLTPERIQQELSYADGQGVLQDDIETATNHLERLKKQHQKATERFMLIEDDLAIESAHFMLTNLSKQIKQSEQDVQELIKRQAAFKKDQQAYEDVSASLDVFRANLALITPKQKQDLVQALDVKVRLHPKDHSPRWEGSFRLTPDSTQRLTLSSDQQVAQATICSGDYYLQFSLRSN